MQELRGIGLGGYEVPEWKTKALGKAPTFGYSDVRPIKEQRESLPIYKLRDQLIEAIQTNQARHSIFITPPMLFFLTCHQTFWTGLHRISFCPSFPCGGHVLVA